MSLFNLTALDYKQCNRYPLTPDFIYIHKVQHHKDTISALDYKQCNRYPLTLDFIYIHKVQHHKDTVPVGTLHQLACPDKLS